MVFDMSSMGRIRGLKAPDRAFRCNLFCDCCASQKRISASIPCAEELRARRGAPAGKLALFIRILAFPKKLVLLLLCFYKQAVSPWLPPCCRYEPSCSAYAYEAVAKYGICKGLFLALKRVLRCHPFHPGGYDPVP